MSLWIGLQVRIGSPSILCRYDMGHGAIKEEAEILALSQDAKIHLGHIVKSSFTAIRGTMEYLRDNADNEGIKYLDQVDIEIRLLMLNLERMGL